MSTTFTFKLMPTLNSIWYQVSGIKQTLRKNTKYKIHNTKYGKPSGFTLIELLVVIAIIGILASFAIASFTSAQAKGRDSRRKSDVDAIKKALELMKGDSTGSAYYPTTAQGLASITSTYMRVVPTGPSSGETYTYTGTGTCSGTWSTGGCSGFTVRATLENLNDPSADTATVRGTSGTACGVTAALVAGYYYVCSQ